MIRYALFFNTLGLLKMGMSVKLINVQFVCQEISKLAYTRSEFNILIQRRYGFLLSSIPPRGEVNQKPFSFQPRIVAINLTFNN